MRILTRESAEVELSHAQMDDNFKTVGLVSVPNLLGQPFFEDVIVFDATQEDEVGYKYLYDLALLEAEGFVNAFVNVAVSTVYETGHGVAHSFYKLTYTGGNWYLASKDLIWFNPQTAFDVSNTSKKFTAELVAGASYELAVSIWGF